MKLHDLIDAEPYLSFHDATFERVCLDYMAHEVTIWCSLYVGDVHSASNVERETQRHGVLTITGLLFFVIEPPHPDYPFEDAEGLDITSDDAIASLRQVPDLPPVQENAFTHYFFVNDWNSFIYVAATAATFAWV